MYLFRQFFLSIPRELEDAAAIDGAGVWLRFILIVLPLSVPACTAVGILAFAENFNQYIWPLIMSTSDEVKTLPVGVAQFAPSLQGSTNITQYYGMGGGGGDAVDHSEPHRLSGIAALFHAQHDHVGDEGLSKSEVCSVVVGVAPDVLSHAAALVFG